MMTNISRPGSLARRLAAGTAIAFALAFGPAHAQEVRVPHAQGEAVLDATPQKVAVFDLAALDILNALGVEAVAGVPKRSDRPANFPAHLSVYGDERYQALGTLFEPDMEQLAALEPDLIIIGGRSARNFEALNEVAPTIDLSSSREDFIGSLVRNTERLGKVFAVEQKAAERIAEFESTLAVLHEKAQGAGTALVLFGAGENFSVQAPGSRFGTVYEFVGMPAVPVPTEPAAEGPRPERGSPEAEAARERQDARNGEALSADPDWIFVIDRAAAFGDDGNLAERLADDPRVTATSAWTAGQVVYLDAVTWYLVGAGYDALRASAETIDAAFSEAGL